MYIGWRACLECCVIVVGRTCWPSVTGTSTGLSTKSLETQSLLQQYSIWWQSGVEQLLRMVANRFENPRESTSELLSFFRAIILEQMAIFQRRLMLPVSVPLTLVRITKHVLLAANLASPDQVTYARIPHL